MAQKITISVSDELHANIQNAKGAFKVSKVCQCALESAVRLAFPNESSDIDSLRERLEHEKREIFKCHWEDGKTDGIRDAFSLGYLDLRNCMDYFEQDDGDYMDKWSAFEYFAKIECNNKHRDFEEGNLTLPVNGDDNKDERDFSDAAEMYFRGWCEGVELIWNQLKNK